MVKSKATVKQKVIITFSRKMMEYQRRIRNRQVKRAEKMLATLDPDTYKRAPMMSPVLLNALLPQNPGKK